VKERNQFMRTGAHYNTSTLRDTWSSNSPESGKERQTARSLCNITGYNVPKMPIGGTGYAFTQDLAITTAH
jgi:hypothetical protein